MFSKVIVWLCYMLVWVTALYIPNPTQPELELELAENITSSDDGFATTPTSVHQNQKRAISCTKRPWKEGDDPCEGREKEPGFVECDKPCKYTLDWFVDNKVKAPGINECLFYSGGMSKYAQEYAADWNSNHAQKLATIWELWEDKQYVWNTNIDNPMRCIIQKDVFTGRRNSLRQGYFEAMSNAMAYMCGGNVVMMDSNMARGGSGYIKRTGIWGRVEFPRLQMTGDGKWTDPSGNNRVCNRIDAIGPKKASDPDAVYWQGWWHRGGPIWPDPPTVPTKRDVIEGDVVIQKRAVDVSVFDDESGGWYVDF
ncbi:hypothetical protein BDW62DRAFT_195977 [Aspergillus aurantiobrunneus]